MAACQQGNMYVLVHVEKHRELMGKIVQQVVTDYGTPVSIVDDITKICPKCLCHPQTNQPESSSSSTTTQSSSEEQHEEPPVVIPKVITPSVPPTPKATPMPSKLVLTTPKGITTPPKNVPTLPKITNGNHSTSIQSMVIKRKESPVKEIIPEKKKSRIEDHQIKTEEVIYDDDEDNMLGTVLAALQNGNHELPFNGSGASSDDGASNSSNMYDIDDEDLGASPWTNPDFLTNFITSQPNIFSHAAPDSSRSPTKSSSQLSSGKRQVPPMLTVNGKTRRGRIVYTTHELNILEKYYEEDPNACADPRKRETMCKTLSIDYHRLKVWFQNRRRKDKVRSQEEASASFNGQDYSPE